MRKLTIVAALLMLLPIASQAKTLDELLVEKGVVAQDAVRADSHGGSKVYWNKGTRLEFPDTGFSTRVFTELRTRYEFTDNETGTDNVSSFEVNNVRLGVAGHILNSEFTYMIKAALTNDDETTTGGADLLDAYIAWTPCDMGGIKLGQFKSKVSRGYQTDLVNMQFADRSAVSDYYDLGRQAGAELFLDDVGGVADLSFQVLNGVEEGINTDGTNTDHTLVVAARLPIAGEIDSLTEGDIEMTEGVAADIGAAVAFVDLDADDATIVSVDANVKSEGLSIHGELFYADYDAAGGSAGDYDNTSFYVQAGYFLQPKELELAARYGLIDCDNGNVPAGICAGNDDVNEVNVSVNYYWWANHLKAQLGYSILSEEGVGGTDVDTNRWILQLSSWF